jgi:hypothetical protein
MRPRRAPAMDIQLWSYNFDPEPTGIGIVSTVWACGLRDRGHRVSMVAAHPMTLSPYRAHGCFRIGSGEMESTCCGYRCGLSTTRPARVAARRGR